VGLNIRVRDIRDVAAGDAVYVYQQCGIARFYGYVLCTTDDPDTPFDFTHGTRPCMDTFPFAYAIRRIETTHPSMERCVR
jgi:hypothetical protein